MKMLLPIVVVALLLGAAGCTVAGVYLLFGLGWSLIAAAPCMLGLSLILARGMMRNG